MLLKWKRPNIPRSVRSGWAPLIIALVFVLLGLIGNVLRAPEIVQYFVSDVGILHSV